MSAIHALSSVPASSGRLKFTAKNLGDFGIGSATASISFLQNGSITLTGVTSSANPIDEWWSTQPQTNKGNDYEVAYTQLVSGSDGPTAGASPGTYQALTTTRTWTGTVSSTTIRSGVWRFRVRRIADPNDYVEADVTTIIDGTG